MCAILNLILAAAYQGSLIGFLTNPSYEKQISTLEDITENNLEILYLPETRMYFASPNTRIDTKVSKISVCENTDACLERIAHERDAAIAVPPFYLFHRLDRFKSSDGRLTVFWFRENVITSSLHIYMTSGFPLKRKIDFYINQIRQAGIYAKWLRDVQHQINKNNPAINSDISNSSDDDNDDEGNEPELLTLDQLQGAFLILLTGLAISLLTFLIEIIVSKIPKKKISRGINANGNRFKNTTS